MAKFLSKLLIIYELWTKKVITYGQYKGIE